MPELEVDRTAVGKSIKSFTTSPEFAPFSKIIIIVDDETQFEYGSDTGRSLSVNVPFGTQQMAVDMYNRLIGFQYQPYSASGTLLNPAAELGDGVSIGVGNGLYSGLYSIDTTLDTLCFSDIKAPKDEEINHEYPYTELTDRQTERRIARADSTSKDIKSTLTVHSNQIAAKVESTYDNASHSFGWRLIENEFSVYTGSESNKILTITADGAKVKGRIEADEGYIGCSFNPDGTISNNGFVIQNGCIYSGSHNSYTSISNGVFVGMNGISLGDSFKVDSMGNLTAKSGSFGSLNVDSGGNTVGSYGGSLRGCGGSVSGVTGSVSGLTGSISGMGGSLSTGINVGDKNIATYVGDIVANTITANYISSQLASVQSFELYNRTAYWHYANFGTSIGVQRDSQGYVTDVWLNTSGRWYLGN